MAYPQTVTWNLVAFALLERVLLDKQPFTSLDFKTRLRPIANSPVFQIDVSAFLQQAHIDGHMEGFEMEDNGNYRTYKPVAKKNLWQKMKESIKNALAFLAGPRRN